MVDFLEIPLLVFSVPGLCPGPGFRAPEITFEYLRLDVTALVDASSEIIIKEFRPLVGATEYPTVNMTSNSAPTPLVALAINEQAGNVGAFKAFEDGTDSDDYWSSDTGQVPGWVQIFLGAGNGILPDGFMLHAENHAGRSQQIPKTCTLEGSNTGNFSGEEVTLVTVSDTGSWSVDEEKTFP